MSHSLIMQTFETVSDILLQMSREISNVQISNNIVVDSMKISMIVIIMHHFKKFFLQSLRNAESSSCINRIKIVDQIFIHKIRVQKYVCQTFFKMMQLLNDFLLFLIFQIDFFDFISEIRQHFDHSDMIDVNLLVNILKHISEQSILRVCDLVQKM